MGNCRSDSSAAASQGGKNGNRKITLALFGLDNAGKTVTAKGFLGEEIDTPTPTIGFSSFDFRHGSHDITMFDLGGGRNIRGIWKNYFAEIHGAIFVVDASDPGRLDECRKTLADVLGDEMIRGKPLLLLANKQDVRGAMDETDICDRLQLEELVNAHKTPCRVESCSAALRRSHPKMDGSIHDGFSWLLELVAQKWSDLNERVKRDVDRKEARERQEKAERAERVRRSRELREKEEKASGHLNEEKEANSEDEVDAGNPFKPIKRQLETTQLKEKEKQRNRVEQETRLHSRNVSSPESKRTEIVSWKPPEKPKYISDLEEDITKGRPARSHHNRSDSDDDATTTTRSRSNRRLDLDLDVDRLRPSTRSRSGLDSERSSRRPPPYGSDDENSYPSPKPTSHRIIDSDDEMLKLRRQTRNWNEPLKPITPTRITGLRNGSDDDVSEEDRSDSVLPARTLRTRTITPPVPLLRAAEADGYRNWNGSMAVNNDKKKKKKARFNQTAPAALDSPEPYSSWRNTYSPSPNGDLFHSTSSSAHPTKTQDRVTRTPLLQRLVEAKAAGKTNLNRRTKSSDDEDEEEEARTRTNARDSFTDRRPASSSYSSRQPNSHNYKYNDISEDDDDDLIV